MKYKKYLTEQVTKQQLDGLEKTLDALFKSLHIDIEFTKHFFDRVNDKRNKRDITIPELQALFSKTYARYGKKLLTYGDGMEAVLDDLQTDINIPFVLRWNRRTKMVELISKTVMRKKNFLTRDVKLKL